MRNAGKIQASTSVFFSKHQLISYFISFSSFFSQLGIFFSTGKNNLTKKSSDVYFFHSGPIRCGLWIAAHAHGNTTRCVWCGSHLLLSFWAYKMWAGFIRPGNFIFADRISSSAVSSRTTSKFHLPQLDRLNEWQRKASQYSFWCISVIGPYHIC